MSFIKTQTKKKEVKNANFMFIYNTIIKKKKKKNILIILIEN